MLSVWRRLGWVICASVSSVGLLATQVCGQDDASKPIGFESADADRDGWISPAEMAGYLRPRLMDRSVDLAQIFAQLDLDGDGRLSPSEFAARQGVLEQYPGESQLYVPEDPGVGYVPFQGLDRPIDDRGVFGAIYHRYLEQLERSTEWREAGWRRTNVDRAPREVALPLPAGPVEKPTLERLIRATLVIGGGGSDEDFFTGGAVIISPDGYALTNFHIAEAFNQKLLALLADGRVVRVLKLVAGNRATDVAIVQLEGSDFPWVPLASAAPAMADDLVVLHHTENRFFTYDRGYVKRYPRIGSHPWMEISPDYAPGGSGCGIFNSRHELVGLVSVIAMGDGPMIASSDLMGEEAETEGWGEDETESGESGPGPGALVVKLAVPLTAIRELLNSGVGNAGGTADESR